MKNNTNSFLFFVVIIYLFFLRSEKIVGQNTNDSIPYYVEKVQNFKNAYDLTKAKIFFERNLRNTEKNDPYILYFKYNIASIEKKTGNFIKAETLLVSILKEIDLLKDSKSKIQYQKSALTLLGNIYREKKNKEKAIELYDRALKKAYSTIDSSVIFNNKSNIYREFGEYENAKKELLNAYKLFPRLKDTIQQARVLDNLGYVYTRLDSTSLGLKYIKQGLKLRQELGVNTEIYSSYEKLKMYYEYQQNDSISKIYANKAYNLSLKINTPTHKRKALGMLMELHPDPKVKEYKRLNDSLSSIKTLNENKSAMLEYDVSEYKYDISELERTVFEEKRKSLEIKLVGEAQKRTNIWLLFLLIIILVTTFFLIIIQRNRNKRHTTEQVHKTERNFSKKVHDELGKDIFYLMNQLQMNPASLLEKEGMQILNDLNGIYEKARDISKRYTSIHTDKGYHDELLSLLNSYGSETTKIVTKEVTSDFWDAVSKLKKEQVYRVLQELLTNMKKHSKATLVGVTFTKIKKQIIIKYIDNGKGATREQLSVKNGLGNVENRIEEMNGTITFDTSPDNGFKAEIRFIQ